MTQIHALLASRHDIVGEKKHRIKQLVKDGKIMQVVDALKLYDID